MEGQLLEAARSGDGDAFAELLAPHLRALHVHCYRMLGSFDDADEAVQEAQLRAWKSLSSYEGRAPLLHWLYRITTTTCLKLIQARGRQPVPIGEPSFLQPYPDRLLDQLSVDSGDPAALVEQRESVALAFVVAMQRLPATQRAALILRDVLAFDTPEVAALLETSVPAVHSLLQRARATMTGPHKARALDESERQTVARFVEAWQRRDIPALAALLSQDARLTMPPELAEFVGRDTVMEFLATVPADGRLDLIRLVEIRANGQPALAAYLPDDRGACQGYGIMVLTIEDGLVQTITGFPESDLFPAFGLPMSTAV